MPYVGGTEVATLTVDDYDNTTAAVLNVTDPSGTTVAADPAAATTDGGNNWSTEVAYPEPGTWILTWTVTGAGANVKPLLVFVETGPAAGGPLWRPGRDAVARYVPGRTLVLNRVLGSNEMLQTFDSTTKPDGQTVDALITDAVAWVLTATGPIAASPTNLAELARAAAAIWAASAIEQGWPDRNTDVSTAADLLAKATAMRKDLALANEAATGEDPTDPSASLLPLYQFPRPPRWADSEFN